MKERAGEWGQCQVFLNSESTPSFPMFWKTHFPVLFLSWEQTQSAHFFYPQNMFFSKLLFPHQTPNCEECCVAAGRAAGITTSFLMSRKLLVWACIYGRLSTPWLSAESQGLLHHRDRLRMRTKMYSFGCELFCCLRT